MLVENAGARSGLTGDVGRVPAKANQIFYRRAALFLAPAPPCLCEPFARLWEQSAKTGAVN
jgi:hypothetical protein